MPALFPFQFKEPNYCSINAKLIEHLATRI